MAHYGLQYLTSEVRGKSFSNPANAFGCCPANNSILKTFRISSFQKTGTDAKYFILDRLEEIVEYTLHLFRHINFLIFSLKYGVRLRGDQ